MHKRRTVHQRTLSVAGVLAACLEKAQHRQPPPVFAGECPQNTQNPLHPPYTHTHTPCALTGSIHMRRNTQNVCAYRQKQKRLCSTPSPWGRGPSNTDVALINWAQRREVGLETTWQFPAAYPPPLPCFHLNTPPPHIWIT